MKHLILSVLLLMLSLQTAFASSSLYADKGKVEQHLLLLDTLVMESEQSVIRKETALQQMRAVASGNHTMEERYWLNKNLYDQFSVYNADSAMYYVNSNLAIAQKQNSAERMDEWHIKQSFILAATGLLYEAQEAIGSINSSTLSHDMLVDYYGQMLYLYSHFTQYTAENQTLNKRYQELVQTYKDSLSYVLTPLHPQYLWYASQVALHSDSIDQYKLKLHEELVGATYSSRTEALNAYALACIYREENNQEQYIIYLVNSAKADLSIANKDIASLEELAGVLFRDGDIDRAYTYMNYCLQNALHYRNRVRVISISAMQEAIHQVYQQRTVEQAERLRTDINLLAVGSFLLLCAFIYIYWQMRRLRRSRRELNAANMRLNKHVDELSLVHQQVAENNLELKRLNKELKEANEALSQSNYVREEYIGHVFSICSNYISKLEEYRKNISRKLKANQIDDLKAMTERPTLQQSEIKEFYQNFDATFLLIYPDFVHDFNALLQPSERIVLKEGELLNTELRIYALVRLGITDSTKIAEFLHYSAQTVYNNRLKTRNKAIGPKEEFDVKVKELGRK